MKLVKRVDPSKTKMIAMGTLSLVTFMATVFCVLVSFVRIRQVEVDDAAVLMGSGVVAGTNWDLRGHLSTMTPYKYARTGTADTYTPPPPVCRLVSIDLVARHGSRHPTPRTIGIIKSLEAFTRTHSATLKLPWMRNWVSPFTDENEGKLSHMGVQEHYDLGKHFRRMFPSIFQRCNTTDLHFKSTGSSFSNGLGCAANVTPSAPAVGEEDRLLRFFDACPSYVHKVKRAPWARAEAAKHIERHAEEIAQRVSLRTGINPSALSADTIRAMWLGCRAEVATFDKSDGWCTVFSRRDAELLEFADDLSAYYIKGHGHPLSVQCAQPLLADIVRHMDAVGGSHGGGTVPGYLRFAHAETLLPLVALMGFYVDERPLTAEWSDEEIANRKWRTAEISPLAGNVAFAQYKCKSSGGGEEEQRYVEFLHNEIVKPIPGCDEDTNGLCPLDSFKRIYRDVLDIDWDELCKD